MLTSLRRTALASLALALFACSSDGAAPAVTSGPDAGPQGWHPGVVQASKSSEGPRGFLDLRGLIHAHSVYSHDACDNKPRDPVTDAVDPVCFDDFRRDLCHVGHDFVMLTDHNESFGRSEYPDVLLYRADRGDQLVLRNGNPVANHLACPSGPNPLLLAGTESATMPVGLEAQLPGTVAERQAVYGDVSASAILKFQAAGAVALMEHTEQWTVDQLETLPIDGFEMYNLHANLKKNAGPALDLLAKINTHPDQLPFSDLILLPILLEDPIYLSTWGTVLASGAKRVTTMATDCHRNSFPAILPDGERVDSYRRMMQWFSNHLLVKADAQGHWDDRSLKDALRKGRLYGAFEVFGYPLGFDYHAEQGGAVHEMGEEVSLAQNPSLKVAMPKIDALDPSKEAPELRIRILRAKDGGWDVAAEKDAALTFAPTLPGVYRAEVRITPKHLRAYLSTYSAQADRDFPWIYSNAIYVVK